MSARLPVSFLVAALLMFAPFAPRAAEGRDVVAEALRLAGVVQGRLAAEPFAATGRGLPLVERMLADPLAAPYRAGLVEAALVRHGASPPELSIIASRLLDAQVTRDGSVPGDAELGRLLASGDPLRAALDLLARSFGGPLPAQLPTVGALALPHRIAMAKVLLAVIRAEHFRRRALAPLPPELDRARAIRQGGEGEIALFESPDLRRVLPEVERDALAGGLQELAFALAELREHFRAVPPDAPLAWQADTALGRLVLDFGQQAQQREMSAPLLLVDAGGDDDYRFADDRQRPAISLLLDLAGQDRYQALGAGAGPSAGVLGYGLLWDAGGDDDRYVGDTLDQAAALLGGALLVDEGGNDRYQARGLAQAFALGGIAVLLDQAGDDRYQSLTRAQGSAGPLAVAILAERSGDDDYRLDATPLVSPSAQLASANTSAGQGMGLGMRADRLDGRSLAGGIGILLDEAGDDAYHAAVFAQGAGYWRGAGLLFDRAGRDLYEADWYGQAAAAHDAVAVLFDRGRAPDRYRARLSTSLAAAHDGALSVLLDEGGDDDYRLGRLGFGAANDTGVALFVDLGGDDRYALDDPACTAFGAAPMSQWGSGAEMAAGVGLFLDLGGRDAYPCARPGDGRMWRWPRIHTDADLPSEAGAGIDTEAPFLLPTGQRTEPDPPGGRAAP